jgi:WD40 repeat protein
MSWPLAQDYNEALQNPQSSFSDPELRQGQVVVNALGIPQPCSGNFADVYAVECAASKTKWAVKCFTREVHGLRERYSEISLHLQLARLPFTVDFQYLEQGVRIAGQWYPALKMHWVEGFTLNTFVRDMLDKPAMLDALGQIWLRMARRLREAKIGHGDLQHGNVLMVPGSTASSLAVKLIDYDGMWVPALAKTPSGEAGHPAYQHPQRLREGTYNPEVDRFSLLVIYCALRALRLGGRQLWERFDTGDNLLFRQQDFETPARSPLISELLRMNHPELRNLVAKLIDAARSPLDQVPHLADLVPEEKPAARSKPQAAARAAAATAPEPNAFQDIDAESTGGRSRRETARGGSLIPWIAAGGVAACAVVGGVLLWGLRAGGNSEKPSTEQPLTRSKNTDASPPPKVEENVPPRPAPNPKDIPVKPVEARLPILDGPPGEVRRFEGMTGVYNMAFSPDGRRFLTAHNDRSVHLWDTAAGKEIHVLKGHTDVVWSAIFSPDGKRAVSASSDKTVRLWDLETGKQIKALMGHTGRAYHAVFSPDGRQVLSGSEDSTVRLWDVDTGREIRSYPGHLGAVHEVAFAPDGAQVVSAGFDQRLHLWEKDTGKELPPCEGSTAHVYRLAFSADGQFIAAGGADNLVCIWRIANRSVLHSLKGSSGPVIGLRFSPDGRQLVSITKAGDAQVWDTATGKELGRYYGPQDTGMDAAAVSADGRYFLTAGADKMARLWRLPPPDVLAAKPDAPAGEVQVFQGHTAPIRRVAYSFDGRHVLSAGFDGTVRVWEVATGRERIAFKGHAHPHIHGLAILPDGRRALSAGADRVVRLWDMDDGHEIRAFKEHTEYVFNVAVSPDGRRIVSGGMSPVALLWETETGRVIHQLDGHGAAVEHVCFAPDGRSVLIGYGKGSIRLWDAASGQEIREFQGHTAAVTGVQFSPDSRLALSCSRDKTVCLWDVSTGKELRRFEGHTDQVEGATLSPDGRRAVTGSTDKTVRLWDVATGKELHRFEGHTKRVFDVAYSPDGRYALSGSDDQTLRLWRLPFAPFMIGQPFPIKAGNTVVQSAPPAPGKTEPAPNAGKLPVPDEAAQKEATEEIREIYKADYATLRQADERVALAVKLLKRGMSKSEKPEQRFVYLREARDLAARGGDVTVSLSAIDELTKTFAVEPLAMKIAALEIAVKALRNAEAGKRLYEQALAAVEEAESADDYDFAAKLLKLAQSAALKSGDPFFRNVVTQRENRQKTLRAEYAKIADAVKTLADKPDDAAANLTAGKFQCFAKEDWSKGAPMLARGQDAALAELARKDMENPAGAEEQAALGQAWGTFADKQSNANVKKAAQQRARRWLRAALPYLNGAEADRVASQLEVKIGKLKFRPGLVAELFGGEKFERRIKARLDYKIDYEWGGGSPGDKVPADHFSIRWQGVLIPPRAGKYKLTLNHDDGARLKIDGQTVIDGWGGPGEESKEVVLTNQPHVLQLELWENIGDAHIRLQWGLDGGFKEQPVPLDALFHEVKQERLLAP